MLWMHQPLSLCSLWRSSLPRHSQKPIAVSSNWQGDQSRLRPHEQYNKKIVTGNFLSLNSIPIIRATPFPPHPATPTPTPTPHTIQTRAFIMNKTRGSRIVRERGQFKWSIHYKKGLSVNYFWSQGRTGLQTNDQPQEVVELTDLVTAV